MLQQIIFFAFAVIAIASASFVVISDNPVRAVLALVLTFFASSVIWMLMQAEFLALILILVYVGAVMTLFLFVIMMLDIDILTKKRQFLKYIPFALVIIAGFVALLLFSIHPENFNQATQTGQAVSTVGNAKAIGLVLYTQYAYAFIMAGALLLVAIIAAISLAHRTNRQGKTQDPVAQMQVDASTRLRIVKMASQKPVEE